MKIFSLFLFLAIISLCGYSCNSSGLQKQVIEDDYQKEVYYIDTDSLKQGGAFVLEVESEDTIRVERYKDGKLDGARKIFDNNGNVSTIETYRSGQYHGPELTFYPNGKIHTKGNYTAGNLDSIFYVYYENGEIKEKVTMADNTENGPFQEFYETGELHWTGAFIDGPNEVGLLSEYNKSGKLIKKMDCGKYEGEYICQTIWEVSVGDVIAKLEYED